MQKYSRSLGERLFHAFTFETLAIALTAPISAWMLNKAIFDIGVVALLLASVAMVLNIFYNMLFDYFYPLSKGVRSFKIRVLHTLGFELSFILISVPIVAGYLHISLLAALFLDFGFLIFFLFYTFGFNWSYDKLRERWLARKLQIAKA